MAWTKAKVAIGATAAIILATGITAVLIDTISLSDPLISCPDPFSAVDETFWANFGSERMSDLPPVVVIRPTKFPVSKGSRSGVVGEKLIGINQAMHTILFDAYRVECLVRTEFPSNLPNGLFDYLANLPVGATKAFHEELKKKFGFTARRETRVMDALLLKVKVPDAPGLRISKSYENDVAIQNRYFLYHSQMWQLVRLLELKVNLPIVDQTGLTNRYDIELKWDNSSKPGESERLKQSVLEQLGLELVPSREPIEILIIEQSKN